MAEQVRALCERLVQAVTVIMEPSSAQEHRLEALRFCEEFKETCPVCVPCGLQLAEKSQPPLIRHFGLQVLEHVVKFRWNNMNQDEKLYLKDSVMELLANGVRPIMEEEGHIKDVLARIVVEMIKREWPQHWPNMLTELEGLTKNGEVQTELVMFILLRLAEDVVTFQSLPTHRRRDIQSTMTQNMEQLLTFMLSILGDSVHQYRQLKSDPSLKDKSQGLCRVALAVLNTLAGYIEWVSVLHIMAQDCQLLQMLCLLLEEDELQVEAAECLLIAISRKGKLVERIHLLVLFGDNPMHCIMTAAQKAHSEGLQEKRYMFLKRLCQVLCALGSQLCTLTNSPEVINVKIPVTFGKYLSLLREFTVHPSQFLRSSTLITWGILFRHKVLSKDAALMAMVPEFLRISMNNVVKVGFPSKNDSPSCEYSRLDYDSDEDFINFFNYFKAMMGDVMRSACRLDPMTGFCLAEEWMKFQLSAPVEIGRNCNKAEDGLCSLFSPSFIQWDAMTFFCECVISQTVRCLPKPELPVSRGVDLLQQMLRYETADPLILSCVLTNLSVLLPFIRYVNELMPAILTKLFSAVTFDVNSQGPRSRAVKNVRRHACSSIIKICRDSPDLVMPNLDLLVTQAMLLLQDERLSQMEKYAMLEAQVLISNQFKDYEKQRGFLVQMLEPAMSVWTSEELQRAISSPDELISYLGVEVLRGEKEDYEGMWKGNRSRLSFCLYALEAVLRRARGPTNPKQAESGGFVVGFSASGSPICRNPCSEEVLKLLDSLLSLVRTINSLYRPEIIQKMGDFYLKCLDMLEAEKKCILGVTQPLLDAFDSPVYKSGLERMQGFFCSLHDGCCQILGNLGPSLQQDYYSIPGLAVRLVNSAFFNLNYIPDFRLRPMLRLFVKPLILSCPPDKHESLLGLILGPLFSFLHQRLTKKWMASEEDYTELNTETTEVVEVELVRLLTREVVDLIVVSCIAKKTSDAPTGSPPVDDVHCAAQVDVEDEEMMTVDAAAVTSLELSELGKFLMSQEEVSTTLLINAFSPLVWMDTPACQKAATQLCWPFLKQVISSSLPSEAAICFFTNVLQGLQIHGQHEACNVSLVNLAYQIYIALRPQIPELQVVMEQIPEIQGNALKQFDSQLLCPKQKQGEKRRKEHFRRLISGCIGKPLGEQFRKEVHIRNLPSLFQKKARPALSEDSILGTCAESLPELFKP